MSWWFKNNHNPSVRSRRLVRQPPQGHPWSLVLGGFFVSVLILSSLIGAQDSFQKECGKLQFRCLCGEPRCIEPELVNNRVQDCFDGSDEEGQWDPSKCAIKNNTSEDIRFKRAAISELMRETNGGATTTYFEVERGRTRPVGLLTTTLGSFVTTSTTTEYITKLVATYIRGTYARILSTSSRIYHAIPTDGFDPMDNVIKPTGFIASAVSTEVHGYATTAHTTDFYRTYIDGTYAQVVSSYSNINYPPWYTDPIMSTTSTSFEDSPATPEGIYATPVLNMDEYAGGLATMKIDAKGGTTMIPGVVVAPTRVAGNVVIPTRMVGGKFPEELNGSFIPKNESNLQAYAELGLVIGAAAAANGNKLRALRPPGADDGNEVRVTGTHGNFIHTDVRSGDKTTYNVFTGTYIQNAKTFLFFFGNTAIASSRVGDASQQTILVENGPQANNLVVDMTDKLKLVVPAHKERGTIDGSIAGQHMEGVVVEIESSEGSPLLEDDLIRVTGATEETPRDPRIDMVTVTLDKANTIPKKTRTFSTSSSSSSSSPVSKKNEENEIPTGRKVGGQGQGRISEAVSFFRPTHAARPMAIPTYTVGQNDNFNYESSTQSDVQVVYNVDKNVEAVTSASRQTTPVFNHPKSNYPRSNTGRRQKSSFSDANEIDADSDLQSAASTGRATVTYVGFADFTTTVGNTVIVFMPRTKMIEDLSVHASSTTSRITPTSKIAPTVTRFQNVDPTRYVYTTTTEEDLIEATTPKKPESPPIVLQPSPSPSVVRLQVSSRSRKNSPIPVEPTATKSSPSASETTIHVSGTQTIFTDLDHHDSRILVQEQGVQTIRYDSDSPRVQPTPTPVPQIVSIVPTSKFPIRSRSRFGSGSSSGETVEKSETTTQKSSSKSSGAVATSRSPSPSAAFTTNSGFSTATTAIYQTEKVNPTGLVTSIGGSIVRDSTTTLFTSLVYGTFVGSSYAQVIKSTSTVYFLIPSASVAVAPAPSPVVSSVIKPTPAAKFPGQSALSSSFSFEVTTTETSTDPAEDSETTTSSSFSISSSSEPDAVELPETTTISGKNVADSEEVPTTTSRIEVEEVVTPGKIKSEKKIKQEPTPETKTKVENQAESEKQNEKTKVENQAESEKQNEIDRGRKVIGRPQDQVILDITPTTGTKNRGRYNASSRGRGRVSSSSSSSDVEPSSTPAITAVATEDQTIFVTRTVPTTVERTYTYYTTFYIPKEDETVTSIISREVTSTAVGFVKKTFSSVIPTTAPPSGAFDVELTASAQVEPSAASDTEILDTTRKVKPSSVGLIYKTYFTTYTYLTTFFTGQTSSVSSREEIVSSVVTLTHTGESGKATSMITPTATPKLPSSSQLTEAVETTTPLVLRTRTRTFTAPTEGETTIGRGRSPSGKYSIIKRLRSSPILPTPTLNSDELLVSPTFEAEVKSTEVSDSEEPSSSTLIPSVVEHTILRTFLTTYTYFTTLFNGQDATTKTRTEVISNTVPTTVRSTITPVLSATKSSSIGAGGSSSTRNPRAEDNETTFLTTYTYITTAVNDGIPSESSSVDTFSNVVRAGTTVRSGFVPKSENPNIQPTTIAGRAVHRPSIKNQIREREPLVEDLNEVGSDLSETSETTPSDSPSVPEVTTLEPHGDYYELESSEMTTERSVYNEHEHFDESPKKKMNRDGVSQQVDDDEDEITMATPALKSYLTTFTFYTTFYKGGTSTVSSRLETVTNVGSDVVDDASATDAPEASIPAYPITYFTTFTYWTTSFKDKSAIVTSREETVSNVVTPGIDDIAPTSTGRSVPPASAATKSREAKLDTVVDDTENSIRASETDIDPEMELTTFYTTFTYFTSSYIGDDTIINSRLETITNIITGTASPSSEEDSTETISPTKAIPSASVPTKIVAAGDIESSEPDYDLPVGLLSTIQSTEVIDKTTTLFSTDVYGTYIDGIYAQVLDSTSKILTSTPTKSTDTVKATKFIDGDKESKTGLLEVNAGRTVEANNAVTTYYTTKTYGTVIDGKYAQLLESTSRVSSIPGAAVSTDPLKTGLVRIIDGSLVQGVKTTYYTSSVLGTLIDNQYAQVIESTSRFVISPTAAVKSSDTTASTVVVESSEVTTEGDDIPATTEKDGQGSNEDAEEASKATPELSTSRRFNGRDRSSRVSFTAPTSKSFAPFITPFASRSRPAFAPKRKSSAVIVTRTDVTPTVTATLAPATSSSSRNLVGSSRGSSFQNRPRFRRPNEAAESGDAAAAPTPKLTVNPSLSKSRFQRPRGGASATATDGSEVIQPTSTSGSPVLQGGSSPGSRGRGPISRASSISLTNSRTRGSVSAARPGSLASIGSSSAGSRGAVSSRFAPQQRGRSSTTSARENLVSPTRASTTVKPTEVPDGSTYDEEDQSDYEPENPATTATLATTQAPNRFGSNRFRLNPRLPLAAITTTTTVRPAVTPRELPFLRRQSFSRPTLPTKGTTTTTAPEEDSGQEESGDNEESPEAAPAPVAAPTQTPKPSLKSLIGSTRPVGARPPPAAPRQRTVTTTPAPTPRTTTKRAFAPRVRPAGFPSKGLFRPPTTSEASSEADDELDPEESQNIPIPGNLTVTQPEVKSPPEKTFEGDAVKVPDLVDSGSHFFESLSAPYESYEYYSDENSNPEGVLKRTARQVDYAARLRAKPRSNTNLRRTSPSLVSPSISHSRSSHLNSDYDEYDDLPSPPTTTTTPKTTPQRFRGRISPTTTRQPTTPFTLTNPSSRSNPGSSSRNNPSSLSFPRRTQPRNQRPSQSSTTASPSSRGSSRFRSRYRNAETTTTRPTSSSRGRYTSVRGRGSSSSGAGSGARFNDENSISPVDVGTITVTHFIPTETTIPVINGKLTEYKTILTPSPSTEVLAPFQYSHSEYKGKDVLVINSEVTATPSFGVTEVTRLIIRESPTSTVTFTPTTIRGRRTSFSHIIPSTVYSVEPIVSTISANPLLSDNSQLTNLLLNQLLGNLNLNPNALLSLQNQQQQQQIPQQVMLAPGETPTPVTQYSTKTTTYVTTVTDFTSTVIPITLHGKAIKTTIVESSTNVITATEFITESTVVTPTVAPQNNQILQTLQHQQLQNQQQQQQFNPALLQGLIQQQQQLLLQNQNQIQPTAAAQLTVSSIVNVESAQEEVQARKVPSPPEPKYSVITLYVSGRNPGDFRSILSTVTLDYPSKAKRSIDGGISPSKITTWVKPTEDVISASDSDYEYYEGPGSFILDDSYSYSEPIVNPPPSNEYRPTQSLDSVLGDWSRKGFSQMTTLTA